MLVATTLSIDIILNYLKWWFAGKVRHVVLPISSPLVVTNHKLVSVKKLPNFAHLAASVSVAFKHSLVSALALYFKVYCKKQTKLPRKTEVASYGKP